MTSFAFNLCTSTSQTPNLRADKHLSALYINNLQISIKFYGLIKLIRIYALAKVSKEAACLDMTRASPSSVISSHQFRLSRRSCDYIEVSNYIIYKGSFGVILNSTIKQMDKILILFERIFKHNFDQFSVMFEGGRIIIFGGPSPNRENVIYQDKSTWPQVATCQHAYLETFHHVYCILYKVIILIQSTNPHTFDFILER